ncbi:MAG: VWA domain-containing protein [Rhodobacteraceae bacterium]|nr:VWA domain-containing protein [Paracoccaceae bacterium]
MDRALDYLYGREYQRRGLHSPGDGKDRRGGLDATRMEALTWLGEARKLFSEPVFEVMQTHALDRYNITELLNDPKTLDELEPNPELLKTLLTFHGRADPKVRDKLRQIADEVIRDIMRRLKSEVLRAFSGRKNPFKRSPLHSAANFDWRQTLRRNLKNYDRDRRRIIADDLRFVAREKRRLPWKIILCMDQSGSMSDSLIHSAVMAAILTGLPGIKVAIVLFDTSIVDVTDKLADPLDTLLSVTLGGGTDIGRAVEYCERYVDNPNRTVFILLTDFEEGAGPRRLYQAVARMAAARVRLLGLTALDDSGMAYHETTISPRLAQMGMQIAAMTPDKLAQWLAGVMR